MTEQMRTVAEIVAERMAAAVAYAMRPKEAVLRERAESRLDRLCVSLDQSSGLYLPHRGGEEVAS